MSNDDDEDSATGPETGEDASAATSGDEVGNEVCGSLVEDVSVEGSVLLRSSMLCDATASGCGQQNVVSSCVAHVELAMRHDGKKASEEELGLFSSLQVIVVLLVLGGPRAGERSFTAASGDEDEDDDTVGPG